MVTTTSPYRAPKALSIFGISEIPEIFPGDDLAEVIVRALQKMGDRIKDDDILVIAQKIVSKSEGRQVHLSSVTPSSRAIDLGEKTEKDPRLVELILKESNALVAYRSGVLIVEHKSGIVLANAGIDRSNVPEGCQDDTVLLLPEDADQSAASIRKKLGSKVGVIINDSVGRAWRLGTIGTAIGASGLSTLVNLNGNPDRNARALQSTLIALADELAAAASIVMGQAAEGIPVVVIRGMEKSEPKGTASQIIRPHQMDLFR